MGIDGFYLRASLSPCPALAAAAQRPGHAGRHTSGKTHGIDRLAVHGTYRRGGDSAADPAEDEFAADCGRELRGDRGTRTEDSATDGSGYGAPFRCVGHGSPVP